MDTRTLTTDTLLYEAVQRVFRNAVVGHFRESLMHAFPDEWLEQLKRPFKSEEWEGISRSVQESGSLGLVQRQPRDEFDILSVNHFYNLCDCHLAHILPEEERPDAQVLPKVRQQILSWLREVKAVRDPMSHPPEEDLSPADALRTVDTARRVLRKFHLHEADSALEPMYEELISRLSGTAGPPSIATIDDTLPPEESVVIEFVGRQRHLRELWEWLFNPDGKRWIVVGDGGKGKSSIAYRFAVDARQSAISQLGLHGVFWLSAKRRRFADGRPVQISNPDFWDLDSALDRLLRDYGWTEDVGKSTDVKRLTVLELLDDLPVLLVVDDLDSLGEEVEDAVEFFLLDAARTRSKVLVTSRRLYPGLGHTKTVVDGLAQEECVEFIRSRKRLLDLPSESVPLGRESEIAKLCEGSPLYMEDFLRLLRFLPLKKAMSSWRTKRGDEVRKYALEREMEMLSSLGREVLRVCSYFEGPISLVELERATGRREDDLLDAMDELRQLYLVPVSKLIETIPRFQVNSNVALLVRSVTDGTAQEHPIRNAVSAVAGEDLSRLDAAARDYVRQAMVLVEAERFDDAEATVQSGLDECPNHPHLLSILGWVYSKWTPTARRADARASWGRAQQLGCRERPMFMHWYFLEQGEEEFEAAARIAEQALEHVSDRDVELLRLAGWARHRLGVSLTASLVQRQAVEEFERADGHLSRAIDLAQEDSKWERELSRAFNAWVSNARARGREADACQRLERWLRWNHDDPTARRVAERMRSRCPAVARLLATGSDGNERRIPPSPKSGSGRPIPPPLRSVSGKPIPPPPGPPRRKPSGGDSSGVAGKVRVYELARELGLSNQETIDLCNGLGIGVKSPSSSIVAPQAGRVRRKAERDGLGGERK